MSPRRFPRFSVLLAIAVAGLGCSETYDVGSTRPRGPLPVDARNPVVLVNDGAYDNLSGEYAVLLANAGGPPLAGIIVNSSTPYPDFNKNLSGWQGLVTAARASGLLGLPDPVGSSSGGPLQRPASGTIEDTVANASAGAQAIVEISARLSLSYRPVVVATGGALTDVADAYLLDHAVADRVFVVSSLGATSASGADMGSPNGMFDPWADFIVASRFRYVQVSAYYSEEMDVPVSRLSELPANPFGAWITSKRSQLLTQPFASDQGPVAAVGIPGYASTVELVSSAPSLPAGASAGPALTSDPAGNAWLVTQVDGTKATNRFTQLLFDPATYRH